MARVMSKLFAERVKHNDVLPKICKETWCALHCMDDKISSRCSTLPSIESHGRIQTRQQDRRRHRIIHESQVLHSAPFLGAGFQDQRPQSFSEESFHCIAIF